MNLPNGTEGFKPMMNPGMGMGMMNPILLKQQQIIMNNLLM